MVSAAARPIRDDGSITLDQRDWRSVDDASRDGWGSEVVQGELAKALRQIGADLQQRASGAVPTTDWAALVDAQVSGTALSGAALSAIARVVDESRPSNPAQRLQTFIEVPAPRAAGLEGWIAALDATAAQLRQVGDVAESHVAWKIDGLRVDGDGVEAMVRLFASSHGDAGGVDITSRLRSRWRRGSDGGWRLHELHADQSSLALRRGGAWLSDQTAPWLAQTPLPAELALDVDDVLQRLAKAVPADPIGHAGLAVADVNGDERDDLYVAASPGLPNRLLLGVDGGGFLDVSAASGIDYLDETRAALLLDFDGDGDRDLVAATAAGLVLARNDTVAGQTPRFAPPQRMLGDNGRGIAAHSLSAADVDGDGDLDLYAGVFYGGDDRGNAGFPVPTPYHDANNGGRNVLLRNDGDLRFVDATDAMGLDVHNRRFTQATSFVDLDDDGDPDLYVANDHGRNVLYRNDSGKFDEIAASAGVEDIGAGMSVQFGDADGDGVLDLYVSNMYSSAGGRIVPQAQFAASTPAAAAAVPVAPASGTKDDVLRHARGNSLFIAQAGGGYRDVSVDAGAMVAGWAWGSRLVDIDNDGRQDILVANGLYTRSDPGDL